MMQKYLRNLDLLGAFEQKGFHVQSANTALYVTDPASPNKPGEDLGDVALTLQMGDLVDAVGPSASNGHADFTPVKIRQHAGTFWVRTTSIAPNAQLVAAAGMRGNSNEAKSSGMPVWQIALIAVGAAVVVGGIVYMVTRPAHRLLMPRAVRA